MASITVQTLDADMRTRLRARAAGNGHLVEEEVRQILRKGAGRAERSRDLTRIIMRSHFGPGHGVDLGDAGWSPASGSSVPYEHILVQRQDQSRGGVSGPC